MKRKIFTILILATVLIQGVYGFKYLECKGSAYKNWYVTTADGSKTKCPYIAFQTMPYNKGISYSIVDNSSGTSKGVFEYNDKLRVKGTINLQHVNIAIKADVNPQQFKRWTVKYTYSYQVYVKETNNSQSNWETLGSAVPGSKSFTEDTPSIPDNLYTLTEKIVNTSVTIDASGLDISKLKVNTKYDVKIEFKVTPTYDEWGNYIGDDNPWYATEQVYSVTSGTFTRMPEKINYLECQSSWTNWKVNIDDAGNYTKCPSEAFSKMPFYKNVTLTPNKALLGNQEELIVTGNVNYAYYNIQSTYLYSTSKQYFTRYMDKLNYTYELYAREKNNPSATPIKISNLTANKTLDLPNNLPTRPTTIQSILSTRQTCSISINHKSIDISKLKVNTPYVIGIKVNATPVYVDNGTYVNVDKYENTQTTEIVYGTTSFERSNAAGTSIINYNNDINPQGYIYQHDDARIQVRLSVDEDLPDSKKVGTNTYYGYSTNIAYYGDDRENPMYNYTTEGDKIESVKYSSGAPGYTRTNNSNIAYYTSTFNTSNCNSYLARFKGIMQNSDENEKEIIKRIDNTKAIDKNTLTVWNYRYKDLANTNKSTGSKTQLLIKNATKYYKSGIVVDLENNQLRKQGWFTYANKDNPYNIGTSCADNFANAYKDFGYENFNITYPELDVRSNSILKFKFAQVLSLPRLSATEKELKYKCVTQGKEISESGIIHIDGKKVTTTTTPIAIYGVEYHWQVRTVGKKISEWTNIEDFTPLQGNILSPNDISGEITEFTATEEDLLFYSSAYTMSDIWEFRQVVYLKNFTYTEEDNLYTQKLETGKYCIAIYPDEEDYFRIKRYPTLANLNWHWLGDISDENENLIQTPCPDDEAETLALKIAYEPQKTESFAIDEHTYDEILKNSYINQILKDGTENKIAQGEYNSSKGKYELKYTIPYQKGDTLKYRCVMEICGAKNRVEKIVSIVPFGRTQININQIKEHGSAVITERDDISKTVYMVCPKGKEAGVSLKQFMIDNNYSGFGMYSRLEDVVCPDTTYLDYPPTPEYPAQPEAFDPTAIYEEYPNTEEGINALNALIKEKGYDTRYYRETVEILLSKDYNTKIYFVNKYLKEDYQVEYEIYNAEIDRINFEYQLARLEIDRENTKRKEELESKCEDIRSWNNFDNTSEYNTILLNTYAVNKDRTTFYVRIKDSHTCYSDSVAIVIDYIPEVNNNYISLSETDTLEVMHVVPGDIVPKIFGSITTDGFGTPESDNEYSYNYQWQYSYDNTTWSSIGWEDYNFTHDRNTKAEFNSLGVYLPEGANNKLQEPDKRDLYIRRIVYSRRGQDIKSQIESISNVITIKKGIRINIDEITTYKGAVIEERIYNTEPQEVHIICPREEQVGLSLEDYIINNDLYDYDLYYRETEEWIEFNDTRFGTILNPADTTIKVATFYIRVADDDVFSKEVKIIVEFIDKVANNIISFTENTQVDELFVLPGEDMPKIFGSIAEKGYGTPATDNNYSYNYQWQYSYDAYAWSSIGWENYNFTHDKNTKAEFNSLGIYLPEKANKDIKDFRYPIYIRRVVSSYNNYYGENTKIISYSNILSVYQGLELKSEQWTISAENICPGGNVDIILNAEFLDRDDYQYIWDLSSLDDGAEENQITQFIPATQGFYQYSNTLNLSNITEDCTISVYRYNNETKERSNKVEFFINVNNIELDFDVAINNELAVDITEEHTAIPGSKVVFKNSSTSDTPLEYVWTLQVQNFINGITNDGTKSNLDAPALYVYNPGVNKIKLEVQDELGCRKSLETAINVEGYYSGDKRSVFLSEEEIIGTILPQENNVIRVYPTLVTTAVDNIVTIYSSIENYTITLTNVVGQVLYSKDNCNAYEYINMSDFNPGNYLLTINSHVYKLIKK